MRTAGGPATSTDEVATNGSVTVPVLAAIAGAAAGSAALWGLASRAQPVSITTVRGGSVDLFGAGVYGFDSVFVGAGNRGTDVVTVVLALPLLVTSVVNGRGGSLRWQLILTGAWAYFLYVSASLSLGAAFNPAFLLYVTAFAASLWGLVVSVSGLDRRRIAAVVGLLPRRPPAVLMIVSGLATIAIWAGPVLAAQVQRVAPQRLDSSTTLVTVALDCAVIAPAAIASGLLIRRRRPWGYMMAVPLLILLALLAPLIAAQTISQLSAGVTLTPAQIAGPVTVFVGLGAAALVVLWSILRAIPHERASHDRDRADIEGCPS